jgi:hypothetical protein
LHQGGQPGDEVQRLEDDVRRVVPLVGPADEQACLTG